MDHLTLLSSAGLFAVGVCASILGAIVGVGGGFIAVPTMRLFFGIAPGLVAGTSLLFVLANSVAGTIGYLRTGLVNGRMALLLALSALPGSIAGVVILRYVSAPQFDLLYGTFLVAMIASLIWRRHAVSHQERAPHWDVRLAVSTVAIGLVVGFLSSFFGIGGGLIVVPFMLLVMNVPPKIAAATSIVFITCSTPVGVVTHYLAGDIDWALAIPLVVGGLVGGTAAPVISARLRSPHVVNLLMVVLILAAAGLVVRHVVP
jgi:uncharacterized membrane protein YfcA